MREELDNSDEPRANISLYEFYAMGIQHLLQKAPWELEQAVSIYRQSFLSEQRCIGLSILLLLGEDEVPESASANSMPGFEEQARRSVNQAVFLRALKHYFQQAGIEALRADAVLKRMHTYLADSREADAAQGDPLAAMTETLVRRVPPQHAEQRAQYEQRIEKIYDYIEALVLHNFLKRYRITS
jgi:hypothetical protein